MNVIRSRICYGGQTFESEQQLVDCLSDKDWRRVVEWERKNSAWLSQKVGRSGDRKTGGGNAA